MFSATNLQRKSQTTKKNLLFLLFGSAKFLYVNSVLHLEALQYRGLVKLLTTTKLFHYACLLKLSLELLEGLLDVLAFFYWYNNHLVFCFYFYVKLLFCN